MAYRVDFDDVGYFSDFFSLLVLFAGFLQPLNPFFITLRGIAELSQYLLCRKVFLLAHLGRHFNSWQFEAICMSINKHVV